jgi:ABC transporter substrate binding protein (PQQ-dependent alcohol dehydrogenase system)
MGVRVGLGGRDAARVRSTLATLGLLVLLTWSQASPAWAQGSPPPRSASAAPATSTVRIALITRDDDERHDDKRAALAYPGHPGGHPETAVSVAIEESSFELEASRLQTQVETVAIKAPGELRAALTRLEQAGHSAVLMDLPAAWIGALWTTGASLQTRLSLFNVGAAEDALRGAACHPALFHTLPSERMRSDALAQSLLARRYQSVLLLHGPGADDAARLAVAQASLKRFGVKVTATRPFKLSADPRERDLANPALLTAPANAGGEYDVVWVVDSVGEFARALNYRLALPRPLVGDGGLTAQAWAPNFERFGAPQLARRFTREAKRPMTAHDWAAWMATKAVLQAAIEQAKAPTPEAIRRALNRDGFVLDGFKGTRLSFRTWDRQLRQPLLLTDGVGVVSAAPVEGVLHPKNVLDTLGADAAEGLCKAGA